MDLEKGCIYHSFDGGRRLRFLKMAVFFIVLTAVDLCGSCRWLYFLQFLLQSVFIVLDDG